MKKILITILALGIFIGVTSHSFAGPTKGYARGKLVSINYDTSEVVILEENCQCEKTFVGGNIDAGLKEGTRVIVIHNLGTNNATRVKPTKR